MVSFSKVLCTMVAYNTIVMTTSVRLQLVVAKILLYIPNSTDT